MSFVRKQIALAGNPHKQPVHQFRLCTKCGQTRAPEGGIEMGPGKWHCAECWTIRATRTKKGPQK